MVGRVWLITSLTIDQVVSSYREGRLIMDSRYLQDLDNLTIARDVCVSVYSFP